jgi:hypothetical protein
VVGQPLQFERLSGGPEQAAARIQGGGATAGPRAKTFTDGLRASGALDSVEIVSLLALEAELQALRS